MLRTALSLAILLAIAVLASPNGGQAACKDSVGKDGKARFEIRGGEALDRMTGLVWQRCSLGMTWDAKKGCTGERADMPFPDAEKAASATGNGWRLPTIGELITLVDQSCGRPAIDKRVFPDVSASTDEGAEEYWTSSPGNLNDMMYFVEFADGYRDIRSPGFERHARLVRNR